MCVVRCRCACVLPKLCCPPRAPLAPCAAQESYLQSAEKYLTETQVVASTAQGTGLDRNAPDWAVSPARVRLFLVPRLFRSTLTLHTPVHAPVQLMRRVREWQTKLEPLLVEQEVC